ncbi:HD domain-containing protein [Streptomyces sp. HSW2009]|uniref:HD-GYP domain-containing protein n=1 Tax=Streptomyces sp. HSW2009 TaxID=3142890 RepID=UPI0032EAA447
MPGVAAAFALAAVGWTAWHGAQGLGMALAFGVLIAAGEAARCPADALVRDRDPAPLGAAAALGHAVVCQLAGPGGLLGSAQAVAVVALAGLLGRVPLLAFGQFADRDLWARRVLVVGFAALCCQPLGRCAAFDAERADGAPVLGYVLLVLALTVLCETGLAALCAAAPADGGPATPLDERLRAQLGLGLVIAGAAGARALAGAGAGPWAVPLLGVPLLLVQWSARRGALVRAAGRQTVAALARATEIAGHTPPGHAQRVALLAGETGRELGLSTHARAVLDCAALLHDVGQLALVDPYPAGATEPLPAVEAERIARLGATVVRQTGAPEEVARTVEQQAAPYREQPPTARILRVVNAYADLTGDLADPFADDGARPDGAHGPQGADGADGADGAGGSGAGYRWRTPAVPGLDGEVLGGVPRAMERLWLGTEREYDPAVVAALARVLRRTPAP